MRLLVVMRYLVLLLTLSDSAWGQGFNLSPETWGKDWTREDTYRQVAVTALLVADWAQTRDIARHPERFQETNRILGEHPSVGRVNNYFALAIPAHYIIGTMLPAEWRKAWQYVWIGIEYQAVQSNYRMGIKMDF